MRAVRIILMLLVIGTLSGCVSKSKARLQTQNAYLMGQNQGLTQAQQQSQSSQAKSVTVNGLVKNHLVPWDEELMLSRAIVMAEYVGRGNPKTITLIRNGERVSISPIRLLEGLDDAPLEPGDTIEIGR